MLEQYGAAQTDFEQIRFRGVDGYAITVDDEILSSRKLMLAIEDGGEALRAEDGPVRRGVRGERAMYWVRQLIQIEFQTEEKQPACRRIFFPREGGEALPLTALAEALGRIAGRKHNTHH